MLSEEIFYSNGKLLFTGEYVVLKGAEVLAVPTKFGQKMTVCKNTKELNTWKSIDSNGNVWFEATVNLKEIKQTPENILTKRERLLCLLNYIYKKTNLFDEKCYDITTEVNFPLNWGLGTSSTFVNNLAQWSKLNPYALLHICFGGSGYDIACASSDTPILYSIGERLTPRIKKIPFSPTFYNNIFFVYLNKKQITAKEVNLFKKKSISLAIIDKVSEITRKMNVTNTIEEFESLIDYHEKLMGGVLERPCIKKRLFKDYKYSIKSLGAWGGDFILVTTRDRQITIDYFNKKGFNVIFAYRNIIK